MEAAKVDVRKARQKAMTDLKSKFKLSEDEQRQIEKNVR
jgi:ribosome recycling factor